MPALWSPEDLAARFAPYIEELHDVFVMHSLHYGSPDDIRQLAMSLEQPGPLREELAALIRSIVLREGGSVPRTDLLEVVAISIAGPRMNPTGEELQQSVRQLLAFLHRSLRRPWNELPGEDRLRPPSAEELHRAEPELKAPRERVDTITQRSANRLQAPIQPGPELQPVAERTKVIPFGRARAVFSRLARVEGTEFTGESADAQPPVVPIAGHNHKPDGHTPTGPAGAGAAVSTTEAFTSAEPVDRQEVSAKPEMQEERERETPQPVRSTVLPVTEPPLAMGGDESDQAPAVNSTESPVEAPPLTGTAPEPAEKAGVQRMGEESSVVGMPDATQPAAPMSRVADSAPPLASQDLKEMRRHPPDARAPRMRWTWGAAAAALVAATLLGTLYARSRTTAPSAATRAVGSAAASVAATSNGAALANVAAATAPEHAASKPSADVPPLSVSESGWSETRAEDYVAPPYSNSPAQLPAPASQPAIAEAAAPRNAPSTVAIPTPSASEPRASIAGVEPADLRNPDAAIVGDPAEGQAFIAPSHLPSHPSVPAVAMANNLVSGQPPEYPTLARLAHVDGEVVLRAEITPGGRVSNTEVISGHHLLRHAAEQAVRRWRYRPYEVDGNPVAVSTTVMVRFRHQH